MYMQSPPLLSSRSAGFARGICCLSFWHNDEKQIPHPELHKIGSTRAMRGVRDDSYWKSQPVSDDTTRIGKIQLTCAVNETENAALLCHPQTIEEKQKALSIHAVPKLNAEC